MSVFQRTVTVKLDRARANKLARLAKQRATTESAVIRSAIDGIEDTPPSGLEAIADLVGSVEGPSDLSTNPKHLEGLGHDRPRHRAHRRPAQ